MKKPRLLVADDHPLVLEGVCRILSADFDVVGAVTDGPAVVAAAGELRPDVVLLDVTMPLLNGIEAARQIRRLLPDAKLICVTQQTGREYVMAAFRAGVCGYVLKQSAAKELFAAIAAAMAGTTYVSESLNGTVPDGAQVELTPRQREVLQLIAEGFSAKEIAIRLGISSKTAEFHKARIMDDLGLRSTAELTRYAVAHGIV